jgi:dolichyl-diphosphooligosaccharide--protein glycosyltransferase
VIAGIFLLLQAYALLTYIQAFMTKSEFRQFFIFAIVAAAIVGFLGIIGLTYMGAYLFFPSL